MNTRFRPAVEAGTAEGTEEGTEAFEQGDVTWTPQMRSLGNSIGNGVRA